jgi:hypothetical protein
MADDVELRMLRSENYRLQHLHKEEFKIPTNDLKHLEWIYNRMLFQHDEDGNVDYMIKFQKIIENLQ